MLRRKTPIAECYNSVTKIPAMKLIVCLSRSSQFLAAISIPLMIAALLPALARADTDTTLQVGIASPTSANEFNSTAFLTWTAPAPAWGDDGLGDGLASLTGGNCSLTAATAGTYVFTFNDSTLAYAVMPPVWFPACPPTSRPPPPPPR